MTWRGVLVVLLMGSSLAFVLDRVLAVPAAPLVADRALFDAFVAQREAMDGAPLDASAMAAVRSRFADEERLLAYARAEGLERTGYVQRRMARKIRFLLQGNVPSPSDAELRALYDANLQRFRAPGRDEPLPFDRVKEQLRSMVVGPASRAIVAERIRELVARYEIVLEP